MLEDGWQPATPVDDSLLRSFAFNQASLNESWADAAGGRSARDDGMSLADSTGVIPYFNQALLLRPLLSADDPRLDAIDSFFAGTGRAATVLSFWPTPDLSARGWQLEGHPMLVARAPWGPLRSSASTGTAVVRRCDAATLGDYDRALEEGYPMPGAALPPGLLDRGANVYVAEVDGAVVAGGAGWVDCGVVNLCGAATLPSARRTGAWGALVRARMADGPDLPALAFTSDYSRPGFVHMGFLPVTRFTMWLLAPGGARTADR